jgi:putative NADH-flavin reductase
MKVALIGATGFVGSSISNEALNRGHQVTALVRHVHKLPQHLSLMAEKVDVLDGDKLVQLLAGHDAVISAYSPGSSSPDVQREHREGSRSILNAVKQARVKRLLVVGGAGSLEVSPGVQVVDTPGFPDQYKGTALGTRDALNGLRAEPDVEWTFLSPSAMLEPGSRTGKFRMGGDQLLVDTNGQSKISVEDYAVALLDELETPQHIRQRFMVGY